MLPETSFAIGGWALAGFGAAFLAWLGLERLGTDFFPAWLSAGLMVLFGAIFLAVSRQARKDRRTLLALGTESPTEPAH